MKTAAAVPVTFTILDAQDKAGLKRPVMGAFPRLERERPVLPHRHLPGDVLD